MRDLLLAWGEFMCHRSSAQSFLIQDVQAAVCHRCFAWFMSVTVAVVCSAVFLCKKRQRAYFGRFDTLLLTAMWLSLPLDGFLQIYTRHVSNMYLRVGTGIMFGVSSVLLGWSVYCYHKSGSRRLKSGTGAGLLLLFSSITLLLIIGTALSNLPVSLYVADVLTFIGCIIWYLLAGLMALVILFKKVEKEASL